MLTLNWKDRFQQWEGTVTEMVEALSEIILEETWAGSEPNIRLIRHYTQLGVLDRPERRGKEAYYTHRQLVQFLAARWLLQDGWMLIKIVEVTTARSTPDLITLLPGASRNPAQELIQSFKTQVSSSESITVRQTQLLQQRSRLQKVLPELGNVGGVVQRKERVQLALTDWCDVLVDASRLSTLSPEEATGLGEALTAALTEANRSPNRVTAAKRRSRFTGKKKK